VAITSAGTAGQVSANGAYEYSTDNGVTWHSLAGGLGDSTAVYLAKTDLVRYVVVDKTKPQQDLVARLVDNSGVGGSGSLASGDTVDTSGALHGGSTAFSGNTVLINAVNDTPVAVADTASATEAGGVSNATAGISPAGNVLTNDTDVDIGDTFTVKDIKAGSGAAQAVTAGTNSANGLSLAGSYGTIKIGADGSYVYTVDNTNATVQALNTGSTALTDTFTYTVKDAAGLTSTATITVNVNGANDAPILANAIADTTANTNAAFSYVLAANAFTDVDNASLTLTATLADGSKLPDWLTFDAATRTFSGTAPSTVGTVSVKVIATDNAGLFDSDVFDIKVALPNQAPSAAGDTATAKEAGGTGNNAAGTNPTGNVLSNDTDADAADILTVQDIKAGSGSAQTVTAGTTSANGLSLAGTYGTIVIGADGSYVYSVDNANSTVQALNTGSTALTDTFTYTVKDAAGATSTATITVNVNGANDAPTVANAIADTSGTQNSWFSYAFDTARFADVDNSSLSYSATGVPAGLSFNAATRTFSGTPTGSGTFAVTVTATDAAGLSVNDTFNISIGADPLFSAACAAVITESAHATDGTDLSCRFTNINFAGATIKFYVGSKLVDTATLNASGAYNQNNAGVYMPVKQGDIVHAEIVMNGVTYVIGGGLKVHLTTYGSDPITYASPLVLDLNGDGVQTVDMDHGVQFDLSNSGTKQQTGWVSKQDGLLAIDLNGDGQINNGAELFGNHTKLANGADAADGWQALVAQDTNNDGLVDAQDANFDKLRVWVDADSDGVTDAGELRTLAEMHITSINANNNGGSVQQNGNTLRGFSSFTTDDGKTHEVVDAWFATTTPSDVYSLSNGESIDLSKLSNVAEFKQIDMAADATANTIKLSLNDVLGTATTNGVHQLALTGDANDTAVFAANEWVDTGKTATNNGHTYEVYSAANGAAAQLLIDQHMMLAHNG
jgi:VCBS repeat-containing protein